MTLELTAALGTWIAPAILVALVPLFAGILRGFEERLSRRLDDLGRRLDGICRTGGLNGRIGDLRREMKGGHGGLRAELKRDLGDFRTGLKGELRGRIDRLENRLNVRMYRFEDRLSAVERGLARMEGLREAVARRRDAA